jgi:hypothetical protein
MMVCFAVMLAASLAARGVQAQNLLSNGNLNSVTQVGSPILYYAEPTDWTITTDPCSYDPCAIIPYVPGQLYTQYAGYIAGFADRLNPNVAGNSGLIGAAFEGRYPGEIVGPVSVEISQAVPGVAGQMYRMSGWAHFEGGYAGGVDIIDPLSPSARAGLPSETETYFALEFLDGMGNVLPNSIEWELHHDGGQQNDPDQTPTSRDWVQHVLEATAPAGTVSVQVRAAMVNGEFNIDIPGGSQNVFFDDFSLTAIPEPTSALLGLLGLALAGIVRRVR